MNPSRRHLLLASAGLLPVSLGQGAQLSAAAGTQAEGTEAGFEYRDSRLNPLPPRRTWEFLAAPAGVSQEVYGLFRDPKQNREYPHRLLVYCPARLRATVPRPPRFIIHTPHAEDALLARRAGSTLARIFWVCADYLNRTPPATVNVWLSRDGEPGGELYRDHIYLFAVETPRAPAEWARELAHEYGHLVLPPFGRYVSPEPWGNGYFGERLMLKWMLADNRSTDVWDSPVDGAAYVANEVEPLVTQFLREGPGSARSTRTDEDGMNFFIGQLLALEAAHGPAFLQAVLAQFNTPRPQNLGLYITAALLQQRAAAFTLDPAVTVPQLTERLPAVAGATLTHFRRAAYRCFLPPGEWRVQWRGSAPPPQAALDTLSLRTAPLLGEETAAWQVSVPPPLGIWTILRLTAANEPFATQELSVRRVRQSN